LLKSRWQGNNLKVILFANTDWYLYNFRLSLARALRDRGYEVVLLSPPGDYSSRLQKAGFRWIELPFSRRGINPSREIRLILRLFNIYRIEKPDVVHHFTIKCVLYGSLVGHLLGLKRIINSITGLGYVFVSNEKRARIALFISSRLYRLLLRNTNVVFQNPDDRDLFLRTGMANSQQCVLIKGSGVDVVNIVPKPEPSTIPMILLPGRMLYSKGVGEFVAAAKLLKSEGVQARFVLVGQSDMGNPDGVPEENLKEWQQEGDVEWWGWQDDMPSVYFQAHIICLPSYREGLPRTLLEGAAAGKPLVATDVPGCREVVQNGDNGFLVPVRDVAALAGAIKRLIEDPDLRAQMGKRSRQIVETQFSEEWVNRETLRVYDSII
jgi:glycosyltransferase involved in cell wall biosynthesis